MISNLRIMRTLLRNMHTWEAKTCLLMLKLTGEAGTSPDARLQIGRLLSQQFGAQPRAAQEQKPTGEHDEQL